MLELLSFELTTTVLPVVERDIPWTTQFLANRGRLCEVPSYTMLMVALDGTIWNYRSGTLVQRILPSKFKARSCCYIGVWVVILTWSGELFMIAGDEFTTGDVRLIASDQKVVQMSAALPDSLFCLTEQGTILFFEDLICEPEVLVQDQPIIDLSVSLYMTIDKTIHSCYGTVPYSHPQNLGFFTFGSQPLILYTDGTYQVLHLTTDNITVVPYTYSTEYFFHWEVDNKPPDLGPGVLAVCRNYLMDTEGRVHDRYNETTLTLKEGWWRWFRNWLR